VLKGHCEDLGRDYGEITRSTSINVYLLDDGEDPEAARRKRPAAPRATTSTLGSSWSARLIR
jgi:hypothetical protein